MGSKVIRNITKVFRATSGRLFGRKTAGTGRGEELTPADVRTLLEVATTTEIAAAYQPIGSYQAALVSGTNIKTINSTSLLGSGDITVSASPGGSSGQVQYNNAGSFGGMTAVIYAATGTHVVVTAQASTTVPLCVKGAASQSANLQEWKTSAGTTVAAVLSSGDFAADTGQIHIGNRSGAYGRIVSIFGSFSDRPALKLIEGFGFHSAETAFGLGVISATNTVVLGNASWNGTANSTETTSSAPANGSFCGTGGFGTNIAGGKMTLHGGRSTGNATPAIVALAATTATASGTTPQTLRDVIQCDGNTTSGETPMLLLDCAKGTVQRVSIGASDSGGTGFKVLRVPN